MYCTTIQLAIAYILHLAFLLSLTVIPLIFGSFDMLHSFTSYQYLNKPISFMFHCFMQQW